jgi:hypothetical protein
MTCHDVFNGDADGLCALHQLRLAAPRNCHLVTGPKRDVRLLARVDAREGDSVTVLDISLDVNRAALDDLVARGVHVTWFDHHYADPVPVHRRLAATIDTAPDVCTAMLVDRHLGDRYRAWAVVAAYGDNLHASAARLGRSLSLAGAEAGELRSLGEALAYAGCGGAKRIGTDVYQLPDAAWSRRVASLFANELAHRAPARAHVVLTPGEHDGWWVSVRHAPAVASVPGTVPDARHCGYALPPASYHARHSASRPRTTRRPCNGPRVSVTTVRCRSTWSSSWK